MKKMTFITAVGTICLAIMLIIPGQPEAKSTDPEIPANLKTTKLHLNLLQPPVHVVWKVILKPWVAEMEQRTKGKVKVIPHFATSLTPPQEMYDSAITGISDLVLGSPGSVPGRFPLFEIRQVPRIDTVTDRSSYILWELHKKYPELQKEFAQTKMLWVWGSTWGGIMLRKEPPSLKLENVKGLKIWERGATDQIKALGMVPQNFHIGELYVALQTGVVDGASISQVVLIARKYGEVCKYYIKANVMAQPFYMVMSRKTWDKLHPSIQYIIEDMSGDKMVNKLDKITWKIDASTMAQAKEKYGVKFVNPTPEQFAKWAEVLSPVRDKWVADREAKGLPGRQVMQDWDRMAKQYQARGFFD